MTFFFKGYIVPNPNPIQFSTPFPISRNFPAELKEKILDKVDPESAVNLLQVNKGTRKFVLQKGTFGDRVHTINIQLGYHSAKKCIDGNTTLFTIKKDNFSRNFHFNEDLKIIKRIRSVKFLYINFDGYFDLMDSDDRRSVKTITVSEIAECLPNLTLVGVFSTSFQGWSRKLSPEQYAETMCQLFDMFSFEITNRARFEVNNEIFFHNHDNQLVSIYEGFLQNLLSKKAKDCRMFLIINAVGAEEFIQRIDGVQIEANQEFLKCLTKRLEKPRWNFTIVKCFKRSINSGKDEGLIVVATEWDCRYDDYQISSRDVDGWSNCRD